MQDESAAVLLELPALETAIAAGDNVVLQGTNCALTRGIFGIQIDTAPVVDIDGAHASARKSGQVFLHAGLMPLRVEWFNDHGDASLRIEYEGPGVMRTKIPESALFHRTNDGTLIDEVSLKSGLEYTTYLGDDWLALPNFKKSAPAGQGITRGFDISLRTRPNQCAMVFAGYVKISKPGIYTFYVTSDDGCKLFVGDALVHCFVSTNEVGRHEITVSDLSEALSQDGNQRWSRLVGKVNSVRTVPGLTELEIGLGQRPMSVTVVNADRLAGTNLLGATVRATGIYQRTWIANESWPAQLIVPAPEFLQRVDTPSSSDHKNPLTSVGQIRMLSMEQVRQHVPVQIRGVITMANYMACVLQDASGGIYLPYNVENWANEPRPGEVWEFNGVTDAGEFSPVIIPSGGKYVGHSALPSGIRPTWSEFQDASLDAEQVDIEAAVVEVLKNNMILLTRDGMVTLLEDARRPFPRGPDGTTKSLLGCVVRLRGVYTSATKGLLNPRVFLLGNVAVSIIEPASTNWFSAPVTPVRDLLQFRSPIVNWGRVKVAGVVLHSEPREYILSDNTTSIRVYTREPNAIRAGDWVEAVGYVQIGGPSPTLLEARIQKTASAALPQPIVLGVSALADRSHDAKLVQTDALILSDIVQQTERVLELQAGQSHFLAKLPSQRSTTSTLRPGTLVRLTGIYSSLGSRQIVNSLDAFELLLNRPSDILVMRRAPWWTPRRILMLVGFLAIGLMLTLTWAALLRRTVARRTLQLQQEIGNRQLIEQQRLLEQERSRVARDLHDELGARLAEVGILGTLANNPEISQEKQRGYLNRLSELGRVLVSGLDEIVWAVNPKHDSNKAVSGYLCDYAQEFLNSANIVCNIDVAQPWPDRIFTSQDRHQLFLAFREALTNVVKHAQASEVCVRIGGDPQSLWVAVEDNGKGMAPDHPGGDGLVNMNNRMNQIGGRCEIRGRSGSGTTVTLRVFTNHTTPNV